MPVSTPASRIEIRHRPADHARGPAAWPWMRSWFQAVRRARRRGQDRHDTRHAETFRISASARHAGRRHRVRAQRRRPRSPRIRPSSGKNATHPVIALIANGRTREGAVERRSEESDPAARCASGAQPARLVEERGRTASTAGRDRGAPSPPLRSFNGRLRAPVLEKSRPALLGLVGGTAPGRMIEAARIAVVPGPPVPSGSSHRRRVTATRCSAPSSGRRSRHREGMLA